MIRRRATMKSAPFFLLFSCVICISAISVVAQVAAPFVSPFDGEATKPTDADGFATYFNGREYLSSEKTVGTPHEAQKTPVVDNAPCLRLKDGDKLVKGRRWFEMGKGMKPEFAGHDSYFLSSKGKFYDLGSYNIGAKFNLSDPIYSLRFEWDLTLENAAQLYRISNDASLFSYALTTEQYRALRKELREIFPASLRADTGFALKKPRVEGDGTKKYAVFENLCLDADQNTIFHYRVLIGPNIYMIKRKPLISGPRRVSREEFEGRNGGGINGPGPYYPDKEAAAQARADYRKSQAFRHVVALFLPKWQRVSLLSLKD